MTEQEVEVTRYTSPWQRHVVLYVARVNDAVRVSIHPEYDGRGGRAATTSAQRDAWRIESAEALLLDLWWCAWTPDAAQLAMRRNCAAWLHLAADAHDDLASAAARVAECLAGGAQVIDVQTVAVGCKSPRWISRGQIARTGAGT